MDERFLSHLAGLSDILDRSNFVFNCSTNIVGGGVKNSGLFIKYLVENENILPWTFIISGAVSDFICDLGLVPNDQFVIFEDSPARNYVARRRLLGIVRECNPRFVYTMAGPAYVKFPCLHVQGISNAYISHPGEERFLYGRNQVAVVRQIIQIGIQRWCSKWADFFIFQTDVALQGYCQRTGISQEKCSVVPNAFDRSMLEQPTSPVAIDASDDPIRIFCPGVGYSHKGLQFIPEIAAAIKSRSKKTFRFLLTIQDGWLRQRIMRKSQELDVTPMIVNEGPYNYSDVVERYQNADLVFIPSLLETFSACYLEAMAMERPLIVADRPFAHDICHEAAIYVHPQDPIQTAEIMLNLCNQPELRKKLIAKGRKTLDTYCDQEERCEQMIRVLFDRAEIL